MVLVPLGVSLNTWTRSIDPKSKSRTFSDDSGSHSFQRVGGTSHGTGDKLSKSRKRSGLGHLIKNKLVSPVQQILEQTKDKEKNSDAPDTADISFNVAASSSGLSGLGTRKKKGSTRKKASTSAVSSRKTPSRTIKRLKQKRNSQSTSTSGAVRKASLSSSTKNKRKKTA